MRDCIISSYVLPLPVEASADQTKSLFLKVEQGVRVFGEGHRIVNANSIGQVTVDICELEKFRCVYVHKVAYVVEQSEIGGNFFGDFQNVVIPL